MGGGGALTRRWGAWRAQCDAPGAQLVPSAPRERLAGARRRCAGGALTIEATMWGRANISSR